MSASSAPEKKPHAAEIPPAEWIIGGIGLLIVLFAVGVLVYEALAGDHSPPEVRLTVQTITALREGFMVKVRAENLGGEPAARVKITAELRKDAQGLETRETQFEYLPPHSSKEAGVFFTRDPRQNEIRLQAHGYEEP